MLFGDSKTQLKKVAIDFIEDYNSTTDEPSLMLINIHSVEGVVTIPI